ncbi:MAG: diguanylate cyclase [Betaproteobacteria bacterium]
MSRYSQRGDIGYLAIRKYFFELNAMAEARIKQLMIRNSQPIVWLTASVFLLIFGSIVAWSVYDDYENTLEEEFRVLESQARLGDIQIAGALRSINLVLQGTIDDVLTIPNLSPQIIRQRQLSLIRQFPEICALITVNNLGQIMTAESINDTVSMAEVRSFKASNREYFTAHRDAKPEDYDRYQLSRPFKTITNQYPIIVSRAIRGKNGQFQGVVLVALSLDYFDTVLRQVLSNTVVDAAALHNRYGDIIYRLPDPDNNISKNIADGDAFKLFLASAQQTARYSGVTVTDNVNRILVFREIGETTLDVGVSGQFDVVMANWRKNALLKLLSITVVAALSIALAWEIQRRLRLRQASEKDEQRFRAYFERSMVGMATTRPNLDWIDINPALCKMLGYSADSLYRMTWAQLCHPDDLLSELAEFDRLLSGEIDEFEMDKRFIHSSGSIVSIDLAVRAVHNPDKTIDYFVVLFEDITERKAAEEKIHELAFYDPLTSLPNRRMLLDRLTHSLAQAKRYERSLAILFLDLDKFKVINDTLGHDVGDELLQEVAVRLKDCVRNGDTVSRQGGDEFIIVLTEITHAHDAASVAEKIIKALNEPVRTEEHELNITTSIGIALYPVNGTDDVRELMKKADSAMYDAKAGGRNAYRVFVN